MQETTLNQSKSISKQELKPLSEYYQYCKDQRLSNIENYQKLKAPRGLDNRIPIIQAFLTPLQQTCKKNMSTDYQKGTNSILIQENLKDAYYKNSENWNFKQLSEYYQKINTICRSYDLGKHYINSKLEKLRDQNGLKYLGKYKGSEINPISCNKFTCDRCRRQLKQRLRKAIQKEIEDKKLYTHFVITTEGNEKYRDQNDFLKSYKDMQIAWNKIRYILTCEAKKQKRHLSFIQMPRAQKNGYCHPHVITNIRISKKRLQQISKKYKNTGFVEVTNHTNTAKYLTNDFLKDHEFYIPMGQRHYTTSRDINLDLSQNQDSVESAESETFNSEFIHKIKMPEKELHIFLDSRKNYIDQIYDILNDEYGYPPPFEIMLGEFYDMVGKT